jgi:hypothetical protein
VRLHDLRHSHATHLLMANVHPKIVQGRLGHANIATTMDLYTHVMPGMQNEAASRVDAALRAAINKRKVLGTCHHRIGRQSALPQKGTNRRMSRYVRLVPEADIARLFNHLVGPADQCQRHYERQSKTGSVVSTFHPYIASICVAFPSEFDVIEIKIIGLISIPLDEYPATLRFRRRGDR